MKVNLVEIKALDFAIRIVKLQEYLTDLTAKDQLIKMLVKIIKTSKQNDQKQS